jgi:hypothetical protein
MIIIELVLSAVAIVVAAALFTNAVEMLGDRLNLGVGAVGSVLAAVGTALPETMIPIVAVAAFLLTGSSAAGDIGVGAILGAPRDEVAQALSDPHGEEEAGELADRHQREGDAAAVRAERPSGDDAAREVRQQGEAREHVRHDPGAHQATGQQAL